MKHFTFRPVYFSIFIALLIIEILIALYVRDAFVRPYFGDFLVVIMIYCLLRAFVRIPVFKATAAVLVFAITVEIMQYLHVLEKTGLINSAAARIIAGTSFEWADILAYIAGTILVLIIEKPLKPSNRL
ncbi:MAG: DUF2809 domain-containing protein [Ferruginibacter sp.]